MFNPIPVFAQENIQTFISGTGSLITSLVTIGFGTALIVFLWGLAKFILSSGSESAIEDGRRLMFWGIIVLFVTISTWGIVHFVQTLFGLQ